MKEKFEMLEGNIAWNSRSVLDLKLVWLLKVTKLQISNLWDENILMNFIDKSTTS